MAVDIICIYNVLNKMIHLKAEEDNLSKNLEVKMKELEKTQGQIASINSDIRKINSEIIKLDNNIKPMMSEYIKLHSNKVDDDILA